MIISISMSLPEYKQTVNELSIELFNLHTSLLAGEKEIARLTRENKILIAKNDELCARLHDVEDLERTNAILENELRCSSKIENTLRRNTYELEQKFQAY